MRTFVIEGDRVDDIASFYDEVNRVFMAEEDWQLGASLDALDDLLYGGFGALGGEEPARVVWHDHERSRTGLGAATTQEWYDAKLARPELFDVVAIAEDREQLLTGSGPTYFDLVLQVFAGHPEIELALE